jgi:hypothetical protein
VNRAGRMLLPVGLDDVGPLVPRAIKRFGHTFDRSTGFRRSAVTTNQLIAMLFPLVTLVAVAPLLSASNRLRELQKIPGHSDKVASYERKTGSNRRSGQRHRRMAC